MSSLIERLRTGTGEALEGLADEAADEIERLQAHISSLTRDMDSLERQLDMADAAIERWKEENEELDNELAALKAQSTEPVGWMLDLPPQRTGALSVFYKRNDEWGFTIPLYTTPPTATALVEDFKRRAIDACLYYGNTYAAEQIESLPLIEGEK